MTEMNPYQQFICKSRYSRFLDDKNRREDWNETVARYFDFLENHLLKNFGHQMDRERLEKSVLNLRNLPSMRMMMTAGPSLERDNTCGYNCAALPIDDPKSIDEAMHILMCGTGAGFSVEQSLVKQMPEVPDQLFESETIIKVSDSKEGWAKALRQLIALLYAGEIPKWDVSKVRAAGKRLKTFGGRASGPEPLVDLFRFIVSKFKGATGRKLTSLEYHDIVCKVGEVVVVGGTRRSATLSLSDLEDDKMRHCKSGNWWDSQPQRSLANNSAVYETKPDIGQFMREWISLYESKSGERGIFNREAAVRQVLKSGRRKVVSGFQLNPCGEIILRPLQFCNLSSVVVRPEDGYDEIADKVEVATILGTYQATLTKFPYLRKAWQKNTEEERLLGVSMTGIMDNAWLREVSDETARKLDSLRELAIETNKKYAGILGIPQSAAVTCVKPEGSGSQVVGSGSGLSAWQAKYFIRRVRNDSKDPITQFLIDAGIPYEKCALRPESTVVFSFPQKAPDGALIRDDLTAIQHLELWLQYQRHWTEHNPSITVSIKEHEWLEVGAWVYDHFDEMSGVAFLPWDGGSYVQAPYESITQQEYETLLAKMPESIDWSKLIEEDDNVQGAQMLACSSGVCEI